MRFQNKKPTGPFIFPALYLTNTEPLLSYLVPLDHLMLGALRQSMLCFNHLDLDIKFARVAIAYLCLETDASPITNSLIMVSSQ